MGRRKDEARQPYGPLTARERARFLDVLRETGNRKAAAAAIGVEPRLMDQRREHDPALDREWEEAADEAHRRLSAAKGPFDCRPVGRLNMIRRGKRGRLQLVAAGEGRWNSAVERRFLEVLRICGTVRAAAQAVGFSESAVWDRWRKWPAFTEALEGVLEEAEMSLQFRLACMGNDVPPPEGESAEAEPDHLPAVSPLPFDRDFAMRFLKWREERRRGRGHRGPRSKLPSIEQVTDKLVRQVEAIKRHRRREAGE
ncbi:MAG TPA: hypothetical protein VF718_02415 [Allosphingosinicella sp.]